MGEPIIEMWALLLVTFVGGLAAGAWIMAARQNSDGGYAARASELVEDAARAAAPAVLHEGPRTEKDDLTQIIGVDGDTERRLNDLGVYYYDQIAGWDAAAARWIEIRLNEPGRVFRERWTEQAGTLRL